MEESGDVQEVEFDNRPSSFKEVVFAQLSKVTNAANKEFRGGYYSIIPIKTGGEREIYVEDSREIFGNGVYILTLLLRAKFDKKMNELFTNYETNMENIKKEFINASEVQETVILGESFYESMHDKILLETYRSKRLNLNLNLFSNICNELARLNYLEMGSADF